LTCSAADRWRRARLARRLPLVALLAAVALAAAADPAGAGRRKNKKAAVDLINPRLGPEYAQWLVGPVSRLATPKEMDAYLAAADDGAAARLIEEFWARLDPAPDRPDNPLREAFDKRAAEADKRYSEGGYLGRRTDRGTTHVLFGPPVKTDYQISPDPKDPPIEVWEYDQDAPAGLSGERPARFYRFIKRSDVTAFYTPSSLIGRTRIEDF
jgi:GWxTD domain-containing protein